MSAMMEISDFGSRFSVRLLIWSGPGALLFLRFLMTSSTSAVVILSMMFISCWLGFVKRDGASWSISRLKF